MPDQSRIILGSTLREHIGGRWAISVVTILLVTPIGIAASGANVASVQGPESLWNWLILGVTGSLVIITVLLIAHLTLFRHRRTHPVPVWWVVALGAGAGASRSAVVVPLSAALGAITFSPDELVIRMLSGAAIGALLLPLGALLSSIVASYISQRRQLLDDLREIEVERMRLSGESEALRVAVLDEIRGTVGEIVESGDPEQARIVSHEIWEQNQAEPEPRVHWRDVLWATIAHNPYPITPVAGLWGVTAFGSLVIAVGLLTALGQIAFSILCIALVLGGAQRATRRFPRASIAILASTIAALEATVALLAPLLFQENPLAEDGASMLANAIWLPILVLIVGAVASAIRSGDEVVAALRERVAAGHSRSDAQAAEVARIRREVAAALHGTVQSQLLAAAAGLSQPRIAQLMATDPHAGLESALAAIDRVDVSEERTDDHIDRISRSWASLMDLSITGWHEVGAPSEAQAVTRIVEEALTNAYRHGGASAVEVVITREPSGLRVRVIDDGAGPPKDAQPGLGSAVLDSLAPRDWSLTRGQDGRTALDVLLRSSDSVVT